jgi:hypothetical protein
LERKKGWICGFSFTLGMGTGHVSYGYLLLNTYTRLVLVSGDFKMYFIPAKYWYWVLLESFHTHLFWSGY